MTSATTGAEKGFVRFPRTYLELPVSPGARCLLLFLCAAANSAGESWHKYEDIAAQIGRSKASIAAYAKELVDAGVVAIIHQKAANGYNTRSRLKLLRWSEILKTWASLGRRPAVSASRQAANEAPAPTKDTERSGQPTERTDPSGQNKKKTNNTPRAFRRGLWTSKFEEAWRRHRPNDSDPLSSVWNGPIPAALAEQVALTLKDLRAEAALPDPTTLKAEAQKKLAEFCAAKGLEATTVELEAAAKGLTAAETPDGIAETLRQLSAAWKPHWKRLSTADQIKAIALEARSTTGPSADLRRALARFGLRHMVAERHREKSPELRRAG